MSASPSGGTTAFEELVNPPGQPQPAFRSPWQAQAFAMVVALRRSGQLGGQEWASIFGREIASHPENDAGRDEQYYLDLIAALEALVTQRGMTDAQSLGRYQRGWERAIRRTPHGKPIKLESSDLDCQVPSPAAAGQSAQRTDPA